MHEPIPVSILGGFLGAGKTTLLNRILHDQHGLRLAVLINDFGAIDIDASLLRDSVPDHLISLPNGCICCTLFANLTDVLRRLTTLPEPPDHILIEASGVSAPDQIIDVLSMAGLQEQLTLSSVIVLADAANVQRLAQAVMFVKRQLRTADIVLLNKADLVEPAAVEELQAWIRDIAPEARIILTTYARAPLDLLMSTGRSPIARPAQYDEQHGEHEDHAQEYATWSYAGDRPLDEAALKEALMGLPSAILRAKGLVNLASRPERRTILQMVGRRVQLTADGPWLDDLRRSELVFIGEPGALTDEGLQALLVACAAQ